MNKQYINTRANKLQQEAFRAVGNDIHGGCVKLQCLLKQFSIDRRALQAHRALDDCFALREVVRCVAGSVGVTTWALLRSFVVSVDCVRTVAHMAALCG